jgi:diacylglycerol kinase family enzyme
LACVLNTPTYGAGIRLAPDAQIDDGWLSAVVVEELSMLQVIALLPRLMVTGELRTPHINRVLTRHVRLSTDRPAMFHGDGESLGLTPVDIQVLPRAVQVLAPPTG